MSGLTIIGIIHTAISLGALVAGAAALVRDKQIDPDNRLGRTYVITTVLTCLTGFFIFQHGGFGKPHVLGIITLLLLGFARVVRSKGMFGRAARYVAMVSYSASYFCHLIPAVTETTTRLPVGAPLLSDPDAPELRAAAAVLLVALMIGATLQVRWLRQQVDRGPATGVKAIG